MASMVGTAFFSAAIFFFLLSLIFGVVGYIGPWLEPRDDFNPGITSIGVRRVCFQDYMFSETVDPEQKKFDGCYDSTKNSQAFKRFPAEHVGPEWYRMIQDMHLASLILIFLDATLIISFICAYCTLKRQLRRRQRPSSALLITKAGLGLWFIIAFIVGILHISETAMFYHEYELARGAFFFTSDDYKYGPGFGITIASGACLIISGAIGLAIFCVNVKKMVRLSSGDAKMVFTDEFDNLDRHDTELERLSHDETEDEPQVIHKPAYKETPVAAPRKSTHNLTEEEPTAYQNIPTHKAADTEPLAYQNVPAQRPKPATTPTPAKRLSRGPNSMGADNRPTTDLDAPGMTAVYQPGYEYGRNRSPARESQAPSTYAPSTYAPSTHYSYNQDTDSQLSGRNRSVVRPVGGHERSGNQAPVQQVVRGAPPDQKHSRYAAF